MYSVYIHIHLYRELYKDFSLLKLKFQRKQECLLLMKTLWVIHKTQNTSDLTVHDIIFNFLERIYIGNTCTFIEKKYGQIYFYCY